MNDNGSLVEIVPGLWETQVPAQTLPPYQHTNCYWVGDGSGVYLVDTGSGLGAGNAELGRAWQALGRPAVKGIILTHAHFDHSGGAADAAARWDCPIWVHPQDRPLLPNSVREHPQLCWLPAGPNVIAGARWLHAPGHTPGQINLYLEAPRILLAGDNLLGNTTSVIMPPEGNLRTYLGTLEVLENLNMSLAVPAHGDVISHPQEYIRGYYQHRMERLGQIRDILEGRDASAEELAARLYPPQLQGIGERMVESHVQYLVEEGTVQRDARGMLHRALGRL